MRVTSTRASRSSASSPSYMSPLPPGSTASTIWSRRCRRTRCGVHADGEHVRDGHRRTDDIGDDAVPDAGGVLGAADRAVPAAAAPVGVAVGSVLAVHLRPRRRGSTARPQRWPGTPRWWGRPTEPGLPEVPRRSSRGSRRRSRSRTRSCPPRRSPPCARFSLSGTGVMCWKNRPSYCSGGGR